MDLQLMRDALLVGLALGAAIGASAGIIIARMIDSRRERVTVLVDGSKFKRLKN